MTDREMQLLQEGYAFQQAGELMLAERKYLKVLKRKADNIHALNLMGVLCVNSSRPQEAIRYISHSLKINPEDAESQGNMGLACKDIADFDKAEFHFGHSLRLDPRNPVMHNNLGNVLRALERPGDAIKSYQRAIQLHPGFAEAWSNLAAALNETEQYEAGLKAIAHALQLDPVLAQAYNNRGDIQLNLASYAEALESYRKATELSPAYAAALINMARAQRDMDRPDEALHTLQQVFEIEPDNSEAHLAKGVLLEQMGEQDKAAASFQEAIKASPVMAIAHYQLAQIKGRCILDEELNRMQALWNKGALKRSQKMYLAFGLARAFEQRKDYDQAFEFLAAGNRLKSETSPYDDKATRLYMDALVGYAIEPISQIDDDSGCRDSRPVFVLGMPRSGTSLTEQILASHSQVAGAGELSLAFDTAHLAKDLTGKTFPRSMKFLTPEQYRKLGEYYMSRHKPAYLECRYVIDKTPLNFQYIGLLSVVLPRAKFIHCHREPVSNCFSIHKLPFDKKQTYAHDLAALGRYYRRYQGLMKQWHELLPGRILDVSYEETVADIEHQSRRMLEFLDLPFEEEVLGFHATRRLVKTPSASQVRQPIYSDSVEAWKHYEKHLGPLIEQLHSD